MVPITEKSSPFLKSVEGTDRAVTDRAVVIAQNLFNRIDSFLRTRRIPSSPALVGLGHRLTELIRFEEREKNPSSCKLIPFLVRAYITDNPEEKLISEACDEEGRLTYEVRVLKQGRNSDTRVLRLVERETGETVVLKIFKRRFFFASLEEYFLNYLSGSQYFPGRPLDSFFLSTPRSILRSFILMRCIPGCSLGDVIYDYEDRFYFTLRILAILKQVLEAFLVLKRRGVCHQDLKPDNMMYGPLGNITVIDFNFGCQLTGTGERLFGPRGLVGTPKFRAPEVLVEGEDRSYPADLFSLGMTVFQLFQGSIPFMSPRVMGLLEEEVPEIKSINEEIDREKASGANPHRLIGKRNLIIYQYFSENVFFKTSGDPDGQKNRVREVYLQMMKERLSERAKLNLDQFEEPLSEEEKQLRFKKLYTNESRILNLLERMIQFDPRARITAIQALELPFLRKILRVQILFDSMVPREGLMLSVYIQQRPYPGDAYEMPLSNLRVTADGKCAPPLMFLPSGSTITVSVGDRVSKENVPLLHRQNGAIKSVFELCFKLDGESRSVPEYPDIVILLKFYQDIETSAEETGKRLDKPENEGEKGAKKPRKET